MNIILAILLLIGGLVILWKTAELLVAGAVKLAELLGISPLVIGLTVVAMGTSVPEFAAAIAGVLRKTAGGDIAVGNVFGSNIANLALVGGFVAFIRPLTIKKITLKREIPAMLLSAILLWPFLQNSYFSRPEAAALLVIFAGLLIITIHLLFLRETFQAVPGLRKRKQCLTGSRTDIFTAVQTGKISLACAY